jgi:serine/threonine protein kinase
MTAPVPRTIGRYEIRRELGRGMMGVVYEAHDPSLGRTIALKTIHLGFAVSGEAQAAFEERFVTEARAAARLSHAGIVVVHDVGKDAETGTLYIALEYLPGATLDHLLAGGQHMDWRDAMRVVQRIAEALHHAHARGVIHRDVKPANVMILPSGEAKIMDFGIAKVETSQLTAAGQFFGTPLYMSPEQALGRVVDARSDLFSLGSVAYAMLTGRQAFAGNGLPHIIGQVISAEPPPPSQIVSGIPAAVDSLIARALAKDPAERYQDGKAMAEDVEDALAGRPLRHGPSSVAPQDDLETELALLVEEPGRRVERPGLDGKAPGAPHPELRHPRPPPATRGAARTPSADVPSPRRSIGGPAAVAATLLMAALTAGILVGRGSSRRPAATPMPTDTLAPQPSPVADPPTAAGADTAPDTPARLAIDFEHSLRRGTLRVWIDEALVLDEALEGRVTRKLASLRLRKGHLVEALEVAPGRREIRVQVAWESDSKTESTFANFAPGSTRRLAARFAGPGGLGVRRKLTLEWD